MTKTSNAFEHPVLGERILVLKSAQETGGDALHLEFYLAPHQADTNHPLAATKHVHPIQKERLTVLSGIVQVQTNSTVRTMHPGQKLDIPPGASHVYWNASADEAVIRVEFRPALQTEEYLKTFFALAQAGKVSPKTGLPGLLQRAVLLNEYRDEIRLVGMAGPIQFALFVVLARVGKLLGYHRALQHLSYT